MYYLLLYRIERGTPFCSIRKSETSIASYYHILQNPVLVLTPLHMSSWYPAVSSMAQLCCLQLAAITALFDMSFGQAGLAWGEWRGWTGTASGGRMRSRKQTLEGERKTFNTEEDRAIIPPYFSPFIPLEPPPGNSNQVYFTLHMHTFKVKDVVVEITKVEDVALQRSLAVKVKGIVMGLVIEVNMMEMPDVKEIFFVEATIVKSLVITTMRRMTAVSNQWGLVELLI